MFTTLFKGPAHSESVWSCSWAHTTPDVLEDSAEPTGTSGSNMIITGSLDKLVKVWNWSETTSGLDEIEQKSHLLGIVSSDFNNDCSRLVTTSVDGAVRIWQVNHSSKPGNVLVPHFFWESKPQHAWQAKFHPQSSLIATGGHHGRIYIYEVPEEKHTPKLTKSEQTMADLAKQDREKDDVEEEEENKEPEAKEDRFSKPVKTIDTGGKFILSVTFSPDGKHLLAGSQEGIVYIVDVETGSITYTLEAHAMPIRSLNFISGESQLVTCSDDGYLKIFDAGRQAQIVCTLVSHNSWVLSADANPALANQLASSSSDNTVVIWDLKERSPVHKFLEHQDQVWCVRYNSNGSRLLSVSEDKTAMIYNIPI